MIHSSKRHLKNLLSLTSSMGGKRLVPVVLVIFLTCSFFFSCKDMGNNNKNIYDIETAKSDLPRETNPQLETGELEELVRGNTQFACDFYGQIRDNNDNIFISPHSISTALAMTYAGARGNTAKQMAEVLHFTLNQERLHNAFNALDLELAKRPEAVEKDGFKLHICNAVWGQKDYSFLQDYLDVLALNYGSGLNLLDFVADPGGCRLTINDWVREQTEDRIKDLLPDGSITIQTRLVLTNVIYFKAGWLLPFDEDKTVDAPFYTHYGTEISVPMMKGDEIFNYTEKEDYYQAIEFQYKGKEVSMVILLPASGRFKDFEASLNPDSLKQIIDDLTTKRVLVHMPKFSFEWKDSLSKILKAMGMTDAFDRDVADFSGIDGTTNLYISDAFHQSFVAVNEYGTEAAAATGVGVHATSVPEITFTADHPFIFLILDRVTGAVLFLGRVLEPGE